MASVEMDKISSRRCGLWVLALILLQTLPQKLIGEGLLSHVHIVEIETLCKV